MMILALAMQAATPAPARFSILVPVADQPCTRAQPGDDIVVCADALPSQALPLPHEAVSSRPVPINREVTGMGALHAEASPCATLVGGCQAGIDVLGMGTALIRGVQKLVAPDSCCEEEGQGTNPFLLVRDAAKGAAALAKAKPGRDGRVAIDLAEPSTAGRVTP